MGRSLREYVVTYAYRLRVGYTPQITLAVGEQLGEQPARRERHAIRDCRATLQTSSWVTNLLSYHNAEVYGANKAEPLIGRLLPRMTYMREFRYVNCDWYCIGVKTFQTFHS
jgi:hypothetical protein